MNRPTRNMRRFVARAIVNTVAVAQAACILLCSVLLVLIPIGFIVAAYFDPIPRVIVLGIALVFAVLGLVGMCCENVYEWAKRSAYQSDE